MKEMTIAMAAIKEEKGAVFTLPRPYRHHHIIAARSALGLRTPSTCEQGFVTNTGHFVDREGARVVAELAGQLLPGARRHGQLFTEDVWETPVPSDTEMLDWLEEEMEREEDAQREGTPIPHSLFRRNMPITRRSIYAAMSGRKE